MGEWWDNITRGVFLCVNRETNFRRSLFRSHDSNPISANRSPASRLTAEALQPDLLRRRDPG
jgi:hypothetical protein